jgi:hypothetical protein
VLGDVAMVTTDLVVKQAKSDVKGVQLGLYQGQCRVKHRCKFGVDCGHGSLKICIKQSFEHFALAGARFTSAFLRLVFELLQENGPFSVLYVNGCHDQNSKFCPLNMGVICAD